MMMWQLMWQLMWQMSWDKLLQERRLRATRLPLQLDCLLMTSVHAGQRLRG